MLVRPVSPMPDESLAGLVARAAGVNVYPHAHDVLVLAGLGNIRPETIADKPFDKIVELAGVLGAEPERLRPMHHPGADKRSIDFFGAPLRTKLRETRLRRVSPRALQRSPYIRAIWSVRPLTFDPETKEMLISHCPVCQKSLGFHRTWGIEFCETCIAEDQYGLPMPLVDLRDFPQPLVEVDDVEALDFVSGLLAPIPEKRPSLAGLHDDLSSLNRGQLFELALALASSVVADEQGIEVTAQTAWRPVVDVNPEALAKAGRAIIGWPRGFADLCRQATANAAVRGGEWGIFKEFGPLAFLRNDPLLAKAARSAIAACMDKFWVDTHPEDAVPRKTTRSRGHGEFIGTRQLIATAGVSSKVAKRLADHPDMIVHRASADPLAPVSFVTMETEFVLDHYRDMLSEAALGVTLGLPPDGVRDFAAAFLLDRSGISRDVAASLLGGGVFYSKASADDMVDIITTGIPFRKPPKGYTSFLEAMLMFPAGRRPWLPVIRTILYSQVDAVFRRNVAAQPKCKNLFGSISVKGVEQHRKEIMEWHARAEVYDIDRISAVAANLMLGIYNHHVFMACAENGLLDVDEKGAASYRSVLDFADQFIFANEAAVRSRVNPPAFRSWAEAHNLKPVYSFPVNGGDIYDRQAVEPHLELA